MAWSRFIFSALFIFFFILLFNVGRFISEVNHETSKANYERYNKNLVSYATTLQDYKMVLIKHHNQLIQNRKLQSFVKKYGMGYIGLYNYLSDLGKTDEEIQKIIKENSKGIVLDVNNSGG
jgi:C-terminal processing protease CtpA/Prc